MISICYKKIINSKSNPIQSAEQYMYLHTSRHSKQPFMRALHSVGFLQLLIRHVSQLYITITSNTRPVSFTYVCNLTM